jgi:hypothetical protein
MLITKTYPGFSADDILHSQQNITGHFLHCYKGNKREIRPLLAVRIEEYPIQK